MVDPLTVTLVGSGSVSADFKRPKQAKKKKHHHEDDTGQGEEHH